MRIDVGGPIEQVLTLVLVHVETPAPVHPIDVRRQEDRAGRLRADPVEDFLDASSDVPSNHWDDRVRYPV